MAPPFAGPNGDDEPAQPFIEQCGGEDRLACKRDSKAEPREDQ